MFEFEAFGILFFFYKWKFLKQRQLFAPYHEKGAAGFFGRIPGLATNISVGIRWRD